jgi:tetratricopeptide (TPR) repeat protein
MRYKCNPTDVTSIGRKLGVEYVVEGALRYNGDQVAITIQLIRVSDQTHLFARKYETSRDDIFNTPARAASDLAAQVGVTLAPQSVHAGATAGSRARRRPAPDPVAYKEYLHARSIDKGTAESVAEAKEHLESAISRDPEFAAAYDALAETYWYLGYFGFLRPRDAFAAGIFHALRALEIDETRAETHALLGQFHKTAKYDWRAVRREMRLARQLDPASPIVKLRYAVSDLMPHGRIREAIDELERALELDPLSAYVRGWLSIMLVFAHDYEGATVEAQRALEVEPASWPAYLSISACQRYRGNSREAIDAQRRCVELSGNAAGMLGWLGLTLAAGGEMTEACAVLQRLRDMAARLWVPPTSFAWIHLGLREIDTAFEWLNRAVDECDQFMMPIKSYAFLDPIRSDTRFTALVRKMNLEQ